MNYRYIVSIVSLMIVKVNCEIGINHIADEVESRLDDVCNYLELFVN